MDYLFNSSNLVRDAVVTASAVNSSDTIEQIELDAENAGGGTVTLTGPFTGTDDATFDIEIVATAGATPRVSSVTSRGVGDAVLSDLAVDSGVAAQTFTVTLEDLGTITRAAYAPFQTAVLIARETGSSGNSITIDVDGSGLSASVTSTSPTTRAQMTAGQTEFVGSEWNFGAVNLDENGDIPAIGVTRIRFGDDPIVYRQYRKFIGGKYVYGFSPTLVNDVAPGTRVKTVTGTYSMTISNGVTDNVISGVTTLYDALSAILTYAAANPATALVDVDLERSVIGNYRQPGQQGVVDLNILTAPYIARTTREGSSAVRSASIGLTVDATAPTETLTILCQDTTRPGLEVWAVEGDASGNLANAITGVLYANGPYGFTIPEIPSIADPTISRIYAELATPRAGTQLCVDRPRIGIYARGKQYIFDYVNRGSCNVACSNERTEGGPRPSLLGTDLGGTMATIPAPLLAPLQALYAWQTSAIEDNTALLVNTTAVTGDGDADAEGAVAAGYAAADAAAMFRHERVSAVLKVDRVDIEAINAVTSLMHATLRNIYDTLGEPEAIPTAAQTEWDAALTDIETDFDVIGGNVGADFWRKYSTYVTGTASAGPTGVAVFSESMAAQLLSQEFDVYLERYRSRMNKICTLAEVEPDFDSAISTDAVWRDIGGSWWVSRDGLLPLFTGVYYHSCRMETTETGRVRPVSTKEFGLGVLFACGSPAEGDRLVITIDLAGVVRTQYQQGDMITAEVTRASAVEFGGGQTGTDELTYRVIGSSLGVLPPYTLARGDDPATLYDESGVSFRITLGDIEPALGDSYTWTVETAQFRWRVDGGSWTTTDVVSTVILDEGVSANFAAGSAPSWVDGDSWQFIARAVNGYANLQQPTPDAYSWTSATLLTIEPLVAEDAQAATLVGLFDHSIPSDATIILQGSDNDFASIPLNVTLPWVEGPILYELAQGYAKLRFNINRTGSAVWAYIGQPTRMKLPGGLDELGTLEQTYRFPTFNRRAGRTLTAAHTAITAASLQTLVDGIEWAAENDDGLIGIKHGAYAAIVRTPAELPVTDIFAFQPTDTTKQRINVTLNLEPVR